MYAFTPFVYFAFPLSFPSLLLSSSSLPPLSPPICYPLLFPPTLPPFPLHPLLRLSLFSSPPLSPPICYLLLFPPISISPLLYTHLLPPLPSPPLLSSLSPSSYSEMDDILTEFVTQTQADAALAHDLLEAAEWNLDRALTMYDGFMNTQAVEPEDQIREWAFMPA